MMRYRIRSIDSKGNRHIWMSAIFKQGEDETALSCANQFSSRKKELEEAGHAIHDAKLITLPTEDIIYEQSSNGSKSSS